MDTLVKNLRAVLRPEQVTSEPGELLVYECDGLTHYRHRPRAVVFPASTEEVARVVRLITEAGVPLVPRGAGTGLSGGALAVGGGVCVELARMRRVLRVDAENRLAVVEAGVVNAQVSRAVAAHGLYYVPDPSSQGTCTVGGNIAENAGGIHCLKYGTTTDHVLGARVVLADGRVVDVANVIWCTGFVPDFAWIDLPVFAEDGGPLHDRGVVGSEPGLYFVGLVFLYALNSSLVGGAGRDAEHIAKQIAARQADA